MGRYDEIRPTMYDQAHFAEASTSVDGFSGVRDVHVGLDIGGPVGTPVFAWRAGVVVHAGYNPAEGDYGNVVVTEHEVCRRCQHTKGLQSPSLPRVSLLPLQVGGVPVWSLYGHLDAGTLALSPPGRRFEAGDVLGAFGARGENGGWAPHVHFQLAVARPATHDLPGVVSRADRDAALASYPDPRHVLGPLYD